MIYTGSSSWNNTHLRDIPKLGINTLINTKIQDPHVSVELLVHKWKLRITRCQGLVLLLKNSSCQCLGHPHKNIIKILGALATNKDGTQRTPQDLLLISKQNRRLMPGSSEPFRRPRGLLGNNCQLSEIFPNFFKANWLKLLAMLKYWIFLSKWQSRAQKDWTVLPSILWHRIVLSRSAQTTKSEKI